MHLTQGETILHIGCREGYLTRILAEHDAIVSGWDPNAKLIDYCQSFDLNGGILPTYHAGVWTEEEGPFDTVLLGHFHSYDNIEQVMKRASKRIYIISNTGQDIVGDIRSLRIIRAIAILFVKIIAICFKCSMTTELTRM